jgi:hypothetical protein
VEVVKQAVRILRGRGSGGFGGVRGSI